MWGIQCKYIIRKWAKRHKGENLKVLVYNTYHPSIKALYDACNANSISLYAILYDLGMLPKRLGRSRLTMLGYWKAEKTAKKFIPLLTGRIVINEKIIDLYAPGKDSILIDGGVNKKIISSLFPLQETHGTTYTFVCAGMLWDQNGTKLILDAMKLNNNDRIRIVFAGKGQDVSLIESMAIEDKRISYVGMLNREELFRLYEKTDILLNLRIEEPDDVHFPSKLLEYMATGKHVVSTPVAHAERDYGDYITLLKDITPSGLASLMETIVYTSKSELLEKGERARKFIVEQRNWNTQTQRIMNYMHIKIKQK